MEVYRNKYSSCTGYESCGKIEITYTFLAGKQGVGLIIFYIMPHKICHYCFFAFNFSHYIQRMTASIPLTCRPCHFYWAIKLLQTGWLEQFFFERKLRLQDRKFRNKTKSTNTHVGNVLSSSRIKGQLWPEAKLKFINISAD